MHHLDLGLYKYQVEYTRELLTEWCGSNGVIEFDNRLTKIPRFSGLKLFKHGLGNIKRFTADEFRAMMRQLVFVIDGIIITLHKADYTKAGLKTSKFFSSNKIPGSYEVGVLKKHIFVHKNF
jgi:hypothetical protein